MTKQAGTAYRFVGAHLDNLHDGRPLEPFATVHLDQSEIEDPGNSRLFDEGLLQELAVAEPEHHGRKKTTTPKLAATVPSDPPADPAVPPSEPQSEPSAPAEANTEEESK